MQEKQQKVIKNF